MSRRTAVSTGTLQSPADERGREAIVIIQGCMASYRDEFVDEVMRRCPEARFYVGEEHFEPTVELSPAIAARSIVVKNFFLARRRALFQRDVIPPGVRARSTVLELNPRILSVWAILITRRMLRRRTILWGHAWSRRGADSGTLWLRKAMIWLSSGVLLYTDQDKRAVQGYSRRPAFVAPNAVCAKRTICVQPGSARNFVQIGSLVEPKRPLLTLEAWNLVAPSMPGAELVFVGTGPLESALQERAAELGLSGRVRFVGHVSDPSALAAIFADAFATISAGYAGLSITHGFAHGIPAVIADDEPHAPEIALANDSNSVWFRARSAESLAKALLNIHADGDQWRARRETISGSTLDSYSAEAMAAGFLAAALGE